MLFKRVLNKKSLKEISLKLDERFSSGISYSSQIVFYQFSHYTCFSGAICPLQMPASDLSRKLYIQSLENKYKVVDLLIQSYKII